jgi:xylan 1,4-beta-xylosidase
VELAFAGLPLKNGAAKLTQYRIDAGHGNAYAAWLQMGSPQTPTPAQYAELEKAAQLAESGPLEKLEVNDGNAVVHFTLPRQAVSLLVLNWDPEAGAGTHPQ